MNREVHAMRNHVTCNCSCQSHCSSGGCTLCLADTNKETCQKAPHKDSRIQLNNDNALYLNKWNKKCEAQQGALTYQTCKPVTRPETTNQGSTLSEAILPQARKKGRQTTAKRQRETRSAGRCDPAEEPSDQILNTNYTLSACTIQ
jgi:hypothetical protein